MARQKNIYRILMLFILTLGMVKIEGGPSVLAAEEFGVFRVAGIRSDDVLWIRKGPGLSYEKVGALSHNSCAEGRYYNNSWTEVSYRGISGYASSKYIRFGDCSVDGPEGCSDDYNDLVVTRIREDDVLWIRNAPSVEGEQVGALPHDARCIKLLGQSGDWYKIQYRGVTGWAFSRYLKKGFSTESISSPGGGTVHHSDDVACWAIRKPYKSSVLGYHCSDGTVRLEDGVTVAAEFRYNRQSRRWNVVGKLKGHYNFQKNLGYIVQESRYWGEKIPGTAQNHCSHIGYNFENKAVWCGIDSNFIDQYCVIREGHSGAICSPDYKAPDAIPGLIAYGLMWWG